jgi:hypothetical protein
LTTGRLSSQTSILLLRALMNASARSR